MVQLGSVYLKPSATYRQVFVFPADFLDKHSMPVCYRWHWFFSFNKYSLEVKLYQAHSHGDK